MMLLEYLIDVVNVYAGPTEQKKIGMNSKDAADSAVSKPSGFFGEFKELSIFE